MCHCSPVRTRVSHHHRATATGVGMKAVGSWLMLCSLISVVVFSVCTVDGTTEEDVVCIHEWLMMSSKDGRSAGRKDRHHLISCWHSGGGQQPISHVHLSECVISHTHRTHKYRIILQCEFTCRDSPPEEDLPPCDLLIMFKWDVPTHHVIQQDTQGPNCGRATVVPMIFDPLWWAVHSCACWVCINKEKHTFSNNAHIKKHHQKHHIYCNVS